VVIARPAAVALLAELGFDVNAKGRADIAREESWETALHEAASTADIQMTELLLSLGADPRVRDRRFDATPLGWAEHFAQTEQVALLRPLTPGD